MMWVKKTLYKKMGKEQSFPFLTVMLFLDAQLAIERPMVRIKPAEMIFANTFFIRLPPSCDNYCLPYKYIASFLRCHFNI